MKKSKYARKVAERRRYARKLGLKDMPWPVLKLQPKNKKESEK